MTNGCISLVKMVRAAPRQVRKIQHTDLDSLKMIVILVSALVIQWALVVIVVALVHMGDRSIFSHRIMDRFILLM